MALSDDCLCGRSQLFTFDTEEAITVNRATIQELLELLNNCASDLTFVDNNSIFPQSLKTYLLGIDSPEGNKALILLGPWTDTVPEALQELAKSLNKAKDTIEFILAASAGGQE